MEELEPPDSHYLRFAEGWLELGSPAESAEELARISEAHQRHPDVLELRWLLLVKTERWDAALATAGELMKEAPTRSSAWLHHAYSIRRATGGGLQQAWGALLPAAAKFPEEPIICFNLACYACQLGKRDEARAWLKRALQLGQAEIIKRMALADDDLKPLWPEISKW